MRKFALKSALLLLLVSLFAFGFTRNNYSGITKVNLKETQILKYNDEFPWYLLIALIKIEYKSGHNKYVDGRYIECVDEGTCYVRIGRKSSVTWVGIDKDVKIKEAKVGINIKDGTVYLVIPPSDPNYKQYLKGYKVQSETRIDKDLIEVVYQKLKDYKFKKKPKPFPVGTTIEPFKVGDLLFIPIAR